MWEAKTSYLIHLTLYIIHHTSLLRIGVVVAAAALGEDLGALGDGDAGLLGNFLRRLADHVAGRVAVLEDGCQHLLALLGSADVGVVVAESVHYLVVGFLRGGGFLRGEEKLFRAKAIFSGRGRYYVRNY